MIRLLPQKARLSLGLRCSIRSSIGFHRRQRQICDHRPIRESATPSLRGKKPFELSWAFSFLGKILAVSFDVKISSKFSFKEKITFSFASELLTACNDRNPRSLEDARKSLDPLAAAQLSFKRFLLLASNRCLRIACSSPCGNCWEYFLSRDLEARQNLGKHEISWYLILQIFLNQIHTLIHTKVH